MFAALATIVVVAGFSSCALKQPAFPTTPAQADALDRVISAVRDDLKEYHAGHLRMDRATVDYFLGQRDLTIRLILNDEQWSDYLAVQKFWWARSLQNEFRRDPLPGLPSVGPATSEAPET
jgi:hypothetical protein